MIYLEAIRHFPWQGTCVMRQTREGGDIMIMSDMSLPQNCLMNQNPTVSHVLPPTTTSYLGKIVQKFSTVYPAWETWDGI